MVSRVLLFALLLVLSIYPSELGAVPAIRGNITVTQADGSTLDIRVHGDEFFSWRTTTSGSPIAERDGHYYFIRYAADGSYEFSPQRVKTNGRIQSPPSGFNQSQQSVSSIASRVAATTRSTRGAAAPSLVSTRTSLVNGLPTTATGFPTTGEAKSIVLLLEFADLSFKTLSPNTSFTNLLNQEGYSASSATGSARDYFIANSGGVFDCQFDVYGPYTLPNNMAYYGGNDNSGYDLRPQQMVTDGANLALADGVDFSQYDLDGDGVVDNIFIFYAGYNEAEGASPDTIWPHKWAAPTTATYNGKSLYVYACTSELTGVTGTTIAGIGTFCHEFSHVFGLYDHYDTDGDNNGYSLGLHTYDIMSYGSYNNSGHTPPLYNALELTILGWGTPSYYTQTGEVTQQPITSGEFYRIDTDTENEFFLVENRQKSSSVWDEYLEDEGLIITHVDMSSGYIHLWSDLYNNPNGSTSHECFRIIPANNVDLNSTYDYSTGLWSNLKWWEDVAYPSSRGNSEWNSGSTPKAESWSGANLALGIYDISQSGENMVYEVNYYSYYVTAWQWEALIGWYDESYDSYRVVIKSSSGAEVGEYFTTDTFVVVSALSSASQYDFTVYGIDCDSAEHFIADGSMATLSKSGDTPLVALSKYEYSAGEVIYLKAINLDSGDLLSWYVDGQEVSEGAYTPSTGEQTIKCIVERGGQSYIIIKEISVK